MKITVPLWVNYGEPKNVTGEIVDIAPHLASVATFIVHKTPWAYYQPWSVTNVETGFKIERGMTKDGVIKRATYILSKKTAADTEKAFREAYKHMRKEAA